MQTWALKILRTVVAVGLVGIATNAATHLGTVPIAKDQPNSAALTTRSETNACAGPLTSDPTVTYITQLDIAAAYRRGRGSFDLRVGGAPGRPHVYCLAEDIVVQAPTASSFARSVLFRITADHVVFNLDGHEVRSVATHAPCGEQVRASGGCETRGQANDAFAIVAHDVQNVTVVGNGGTIWGFTDGISLGNVADVIVRDFRLRELTYPISGFNTVRLSVTNNLVERSRFGINVAHARGIDVSSNRIELTQRPSTPQIAIWLETVTGVVRQNQITLAARGQPSVRTDHHADQCPDRFATNGNVGIFVYANTQAEIRALGLHDNAIYNAAVGSGVCTLNEEALDGLSSPHQHIFATQAGNDSHNLTQRNEWFDATTLGASVVSDLQSTRSGTTR